MRSVARSGQETTTEVQLRTILREAVDRFNHELMDDEGRQLLIDRLRQLRRQLETKT